MKKCKCCDKPKSLKILINGPDNVGKSTLINNLINHYKLPFINIHNYKPPKLEKDLSIDFELLLAEYYFKIINDFDFVIFDRCYLGCNVYGKIYRGYEIPEIYEMESKYIENFDDIILITLIDKPENLIKREDGYSISIKNEDKIKEIELFKEVHNKSNIKNKILFNIDGYDEYELLDEIINLIDEF